MNILCKYTLESLKKNKTRTVVTIIGIILSVSMFTAVTEAVASMRHYMLRAVQESVGKFYIQVRNVDDSSVEAVKSTDNIGENASLDFEGFAEIGSQNASKPYLCIADISQNFKDLVALKLVSGRMPENNGEILLPLHLSSNGGVRYSTGDSFTVFVGKRMYDGQILSQYTEHWDGETLENLTEKTFTVVGFYERFSTDVEPYYAPGYTALTVGGTGDSHTVFAKTKSLSGVFSTVDDLAGLNVGEVKYNRDLLMFMGVSHNQNAMSVLNGMAAILIGIIMFGSIALIYNSFSISVGQRTKQFGILKSIGATKKQIRRTVLYEALMLCVIGVPLGLLAGCGGLGITLYLLRDSIDAISAYSFESGVALNLFLSPAALLGASLIGVVTTVVSAFIPAMRAVRVPVIEAVRRTTDIKVKSTRVRLSGLIYKLFGFEGLIAAKNFKRNKKQYRTAIFSLFVSVVLFVSASSFCRYLTDSVGVVNKTSDFDIYYSSAERDAESVFKQLKSVTGVEEAYITHEIPERVILDDRYKSDYNKTANSDLPFDNIIIDYIDDAQYDELARENGIAYDKNNPGAIVYDSFRALVEKNGSYMISVESMLDKKAAADKLEGQIVNEMPGYYISGMNDGNIVFAADNGDSDVPSNEETLEIPLSECSSRFELNIAGYIEKQPVYTEKEFVLFMPLSAMNNDGGDILKCMYFKAGDTRNVYNKMTGILNENGYDTSMLTNYTEGVRAQRALVTIINVFAYGFIILISLIALTNVFNTVSTNIFLRRREFAMYKSVGITRGGFNKMMNYECIICGLRGLLFGLPTSVLVTFLIYRVVSNGYTAGFYIPVVSIAVSVISVFAVIFFSMLYSTGKIRHENIMETLRNENI